MQIEHCDLCGKEVPNTLGPRSMLTKYNEQILFSKIEKHKSIVYRLNEPNIEGSFDLEKPLIMCSECYLSLRASIYALRGNGWK